jgi:hypothetical protein
MLSGMVKVTPDPVMVEPRFICDEMLIRLARWLRAAGYDTELVEPETSDRDLMAHAVAENLIILTRDRKFLERRGAETHVFLITSGKVDGQVREITAPFAIDWLRAPFCRCIVDSTMLVPAEDDQLATLPWSARGVDGPYRTCPACKRVYWNGGHAKHMRAQLEQWAGIMAQ